LDDLTFFCLDDKLLLMACVLIWFAEADRWMNKELDKLPKPSTVSVDIVFATFYT